MSTPDPVELMEARIERLEEAFIDDETCMGCYRKVDYELICLSPMGDGPALCATCAGLPEENTGPTRG